MTLVEYDDLFFCENSILKVLNPRSQITQFTISPSKNPVIPRFKTVIGLHKTVPKTEKPKNDDGNEKKI